VICEYLNSFKNGHFFPTQSIWRSESGRWRALGLQALGDGVSDAAVVCVSQRRLAEDRRDEAAVMRAMDALAASLDVLEKAAAKFAEYPTIGEVAVGCALGYLDFRLPDLAWRATRPALRGWHDGFLKYPAVMATAPAELT
jgi:glutathione S-transferase